MGNPSTQELVVKGSGNVFTLQGAGFSNATWSATSGRLSDDGSSALSWTNYIKGDRDSLILTAGTTSDGFLYQKKVFVRLK